MAAASAINEHIGEGLACSDEAFAAIIDECMAAERKAVEEIIERTGDYYTARPMEEAIEAYRAARGIK